MGEMPYKKTLHTNVCSKVNFHLTFEPLLGKYRVDSNIFGGIYIFIYIFAPQYSTLCAHNLHKTLQHYDLSVIAYVLRRWN